MSILPLRRMLALVRPHINKANMSSIVEKIVNDDRPCQKVSSILETIGKTPLVRLNRLAPSGVNIFVKCEFFNPTGSVKDRFALGCIEWAEKEGHLKPGHTVIECSSGNTGIGLAMVCNVKGYPFVCVMSEACSIERRKLMRFLGASVILTNPSHKVNLICESHIIA
jgi:cysteine synthase A